MGKVEQRRGSESETGAKGRREGKAARSSLAHAQDMGGWEKESKAREEGEKWLLTQQCTFCAIVQ